jgi:NDP-sugar pyrophosphorylase family protein
MMGDDIYALKDIRKCLKHEWAILVQERNPLHSGGKVIMDTHRRITGIEEGTHKGSGCINAALYVLDTRVFDYPLIAKSSDSTEYGLPQVMMQACKDIDIHAVPATLWIQITEPADIAKAEKALEGE